LPFYIAANGVVLCPGAGDRGAIPSQYFRSVSSVKTKEFIYQQPFDYICVYDFECNCAKNNSDIKFNEIIEFPVVIFDVKKKKRVAEFHTYVRPTVDPAITPFCTELTGITNDMAFKDKNGKPNPTIEEAIVMLHKFLESKKIFEGEFIFMSCGDFDGNQMSREAKFKGFSIPNYLQRWINLKKAFPPKQMFSTINNTSPDEVNKDSFTEFSASWNQKGQIKKAKP